MVWQAYQKVKSNQGSSGIANMDWATLDRKLGRHLYRLWSRLSSGSYFPKAVKEVAIKKKSGGVRKLGIPTILDRIAQQVVKTHLEGKVEPHFHNSSYGYRPKRNCHQAVGRALQNVFTHHIRGVINYYCKFWSHHTQPLWHQLNQRFKKWVQWEKGLYQMASARWLKKKCDERPGLFAHWKLVHP